MCVQETLLEIQHQLKDVQQNVKQVNIRNQIQLKQHAFVMKIAIMQMTVMER